MGSLTPYSMLFPLSPVADSEAKINLCHIRSILNTILQQCFKKYVFPDLKLDARC